MAMDHRSFAPLSSDHVSPTLKMLEADRESDNPRYAIHEPEAACTSCPIAVWYLAGEDLECFCPALHQVPLPELCCHGALSAGKRGLLLEWYRVPHLHLLAL